MAQPQKPELETVELNQFEAIAPRGTREVTWFWRSARGDGWRNIAELSGAESERLDPGPGMVWESRVTITVGYGSWLMRVESKPGPEKRLDALAYLQQDRRSVARRVERQYFRVGRRGTVVRVRDEPPAPKQ